ncbi:hypothetical protein Fot_23894 [Forsythia ovata]|uniref:Uncharacterized protein n=1 Tax=Forsythia ovata TaxID=205694 RepID=A0ABD1U4N9_9LAMI
MGSFASKELQKNENVDKPISDKVVQSCNSKKINQPHVYETQGSVFVLIVTRPDDFLGNLKSYVSEEDGVVILKLAGELCILIFFLEWVVLTLAFFLKYYAYIERDGANSQATRSAKVQNDEDLNYLPYPFQGIYVPVSP